MIRKIIYCIALSFLLLSSFPVCASAEVLPMSYSETIDSFSNPERGFYVPVMLKLKESDTSISERYLNNNFIHLRVDISSFGENGTRISDSALEALDQTLEIIKKNGGTTILRFAYDSYFSGKTVLEPGLKMMKTHIEQISPILEKHEPVIACIEAGMLGLYGEYHGTAKCTAKNRTAIIQTWLDHLSSKFMVNVRTPGYIAAWAGITLEQLCRNGSKKKGIERIGIYNDGYLGSNSDLGTYANREDELDWIDEQADNTFFGGEISNYIEKDTPKNTAKYMESEGFLTHTSYLNIQWNYTVIENLKKEIFNGKDSLYQGSSGYKYIDNHLGYRFVLTGSQVTASGHYLNLFIQINNVGFGSMVNDKKTTVILESENDRYELPLEDFDIRTCKSQYQIKYQNHIDINDIKTGDYHVYLRISEYGDYTSDDNYNCVRFANDSSQWNELFGANRIGDVQIGGSKSGNETGNESENETVNRTGTDAPDQPYVRSFEIHDLNQRFYTISGIRYKLDGKNAVIKRPENKKSITIPKKISINGATCPVTGLNSRIFSDCTKAQTIKILNSTKELPAGTFSSCKKLKTITLSKSIKSISQGSLPEKSLKKIIYLGKKSQFDRLGLNWLHRVKVRTANKTFTLK